MPKHVVRQGECISSIAARYGVTPDVLRQQNQELFDQRSNGYVLHPGDIVEAPAPSAASRSASFTAGGRQSYTVTVPSAALKVKVMDESGAPVKNQPFTVCAGRIKRTGETDGEGFVSTSLPVYVTTAQLEVQFPEDEEPHVFTLQLGHLDPITAISGVRQRLSNLGFLGHETASVDAVGLAIKRYQRARGMEVTGQLDQAGRDRLVSEHGS